MIRFRMVKITTTQFAIVGDMCGEIDEIGIELGFNVKYSMDMRRIGVSPLLTLMSENDDKLLILELFCEFEVHPDDWQGMITDNRLIINKDFLGNLISQSIGTLRGVLYCKTEGTSYSNFVLPSVSISELVNTDAEFKLEQLK